MATSGGKETIQSQANEVAYAKQLEYAKAKMDVTRLESRYTDILNNIGMLTSQLKSSGYDKYPKDWVRVCEHKDRVEKTVSKI